MTKEDAAEWLPGCGLLLQPAGVALAAVYLGQPVDPAYWDDTADPRRVLLGILGVVILVLSASSIIVGYLYRRRPTAPESGAIEFHS